jgi:2'-5' RNA ligase
MPRRIFIAINLPKEIKAQLLNYQRQIKDLPIRWVKEDNLHITLIFLGYLKDEEVAGVCRLTKGVAQKTSSFSINLNKICYGPPQKIPPRMIWAVGKKSQELASLKDNLEKELLGAPALNNLKTEARAFSPHITLGRIRQWEWRQIEPEERPQVEKEIFLNFEVQSIEAMESRLKRGGAEYTILEACPLKS